MMEKVAAGAAGTPYSSSMHLLCSQVILRNADGKYLLQLRKRGPNLGNWALVGGKLEVIREESPLGCAVREVAEETGMTLNPLELRLRCLLHERNFGAKGRHWTIFIYEYNLPVETLPPPMEEGHYAFFDSQEMLHLPMLANDRKLILRNCDKLQGADLVTAEINCKGGLEGDILITEIRYHSSTINTAGGATPQA